MVNVTICTVLLLHVLVVASLQIKRQDNGDEVINGEKCANQRTYVFVASQTKPVRCVSNMKEAGCDWELKSKSLTFGFVPNETIKATTCHIRLMEKTHFPDGQLCRNHSDEKIEVQNTNAYLNTSIGVPILANISNAL
ncbi:uncharacterized protein LOC130625582 [Hydractinia symbiolongicarpus]|uniref:uncharacterized protein LOC130625582 n=1 Tax=Hydractinia symbiolongicarpus TaxID=13093 RepID=UPI00254F4BBF|nr:uncharacterized protein LOC130625582 [Hydractinia symbiolongicarpus]